ncbi:four-carbon acid sugar kinase family protein [Formosa sp. A9]|uniref:four-carbon acid sugar kinase family protein n=1 Tax=Formosa sp. A9 TaxID=3442641 RepID=UPI003EBEC3C8
MLVVIADDLTGAAEIAGVCLRRQIPVAFGIDAIPEVLKPVTIIATDTRSLSETEAHYQHLKIAKQLKLKGDVVVFKKCDSVLRGHVLSELSALLTVFEKDRVLLQPSNPLGKRCVKDGVYLINNIPIAETHFASDPDFPARFSEVKNILSDKSLKFNTVRSVCTGGISTIGHAGVFVPDCTSEKDLAKSSALYNNSMLLAGSAAFFDSILYHLVGAVAHAVPDVKVFEAADRFVLVSGSAFPESLQFAEQLSNKGVPLLYFPDAMLKPSCEPKVCAGFSKKLIKTYKRESRLVLRIAREDIVFPESSKLLKERLSTVLNQLVSKTQIPELFVEGGATAYHLLKTLGWTDCVPVQELAHGVVRLVNTQNKKAHITIKPGSYRWPEQVFKC